MYYYPIDNEEDLCQTNQTTQKVSGQTIKRKPQNTVVHTIEPNEEIMKDALTPNSSLFFGRLYHED